MQTIQQFWKQHKTTLIETCENWELPTWAVALVIYGAWLTLTYYADVLPWYVLLALGPLVIAWHGALQHEASHGHPISFRVADIIGTPPLGLITPLQLYRKYHLTHHANQHLTDPARDPESFYFHKKDWDALPRWTRAILLANQTFAGRMLLGPAISCYRFLKWEMGKLLHGDFTHARIWLKHAFYISLVLYWVMGIGGMSFMEYVVYFVYPGTSLAMIRSFYEHRYDASIEGRIVVVENSPFFQLLFLNNNFHVVHHDLPRMPWFKIDEHYRANRLHYRTLNRNFVVPSYGGLMREYMFKPVFHPVHPLDDQTLHTDLESEETPVSAEVVAREERML